MIGDPLPENQVGLFNPQGGFDQQLIKNICLVHIPDAGLCNNQVQIIGELLSVIKGYGLRLNMADNVKFLTLMVPGRNRVIEAELHIRATEGGEIAVNATLQQGEVVFIKFKGVYSKE